MRWSVGGTALRALQLLSSGLLSFCEPLRSIAESNIRAILLRNRSTLVPRMSPSLSMQRSQERAEWSAVGGGRRRPPQPLAGQTVGTRILTGPTHTDICQNILATLSS